MSEPVDPEQAMARAIEAIQAAAPALRAFSEALDAAAVHAATMANIAAQDAAEMVAILNGEIEP